MKKYLIFYWYVKPDGWCDIYDLHLKNLMSVKNIFDKAKFVLAIDDDIKHSLVTFTIDKIKNIFPNSEIEFFKNDKDNREAAFFYHEIINKLNCFDKNSVVFFAHNKGVNSRYTTNEDVIDWINCLYFCNLYNENVIDEYLSDENTITIGSCLVTDYKYGDYNFSDCTYGWHYQGTFFWFVPDRLLSYIKEECAVLPKLCRYYAEKFFGSIIPLKSNHSVGLYGSKPVTGTYKEYIRENFSKKEIDEFSWFIKKRCVIVIPIYKQFKDLTDGELASLEQLRIVFSEKYEITFLTHDLIDISEYQVIFDDSTKLSTIYIDKKHFLTRENYAKFVSEKTFYEYFDSYQYMLIYQLDAFVFYDKLEYWCSLGYDYIGAPFFMEDFAKEGKMVGNGGFSLRKVWAMINYINKNGDIDTPNRWCDDTFFSMNYGNILNIPTIDIARKFSIECRVQEQFKLAGTIPFGCHAFEKYDRNFWLQYIPLYENAYNLLIRYLQNKNTKINTQSDWWLYDKLSITAYYSGYKKDSLLYGFMARELNCNNKRLQDNVNVILDNINKTDILD